MADDENIVKRTCKELGLTKKDIKGIRESVLKGFMLYYKQNLDAVKLSKPELSKLLDRVREFNVFEATNPKDTPEMIRQLLNGELVVNDDGTTNKIVSISKMVEDMPFLDGILNTKTNINIKTEDITPLFVKNFCKEQNWTYRDLAEHIGSVEGTIINWMSKGSIPLWAQKSISYIVEIERLKNDADSSAYQLNELRESWHKINTILSPLNNDYSLKYSLYKGDKISYPL
jgi:transcriptional regulator with XRE-family HTH domain